MGAADGSWLVVGGDSMLGRAVLAVLEAAGLPALATTRRPGRLGPGRTLLDLAADPGGWDLPAHVGTAVICAAVTPQAACRRDPAGSRRVNVTATAALAGQLAAAGAFVVLLSTNLVLDGERPRAAPTEAVRPRSEYGRQKAAAEAALLGLGAAAAIVRLTKVLASPQPLFGGWFEALRAARPIHPFADMVMAPIPPDFAARAVVAVGRERAAGITQVSGEADVAYAEVGERAARLAEADPGLVQPVSYRAADIDPEEVPRHTVLDTERLREDLGLTPPPVWATIEHSLRASA